MSRSRGRKLTWTFNRRQLERELGKVEDLQDQVNDVRTKVEGAEKKRRRRKRRIRSAFARARAKIGAAVSRLRGVRGRR